MKPKLILGVFQNKNFLSLLTNISIAAFGLLSFLFLARSLDKEQFGAWILYLTASGLIEMMRFGLTKIAIIRFLSGAKTCERANIIGSNWLISIITTFLLAFLISLFYFIFSSHFGESGYKYFFLWYPAMLFINLPFNNTLAIFEADQKFGSMLKLRFITGSFFLIFLIINYLFYNLNLTWIIIAHLITHFVSSLYCVVFKMDGMQEVFKSSKETVKKFLHFGKFTLGTLMGSSLLKSADVMIIGLSTMGSTAVALYSIPMKLIEIMQIPLRSFSSTAYPKMSNASIKGAQKEVIRLFYIYSGVTTLLFMPISIACFFFSKTFVNLLGGSQYLDSMIPVVILKIFALYGLLLPIDRFTGITLDAINKPKTNFYKVLVMAITNIIGDFIAVFVFKSLILVAIVTIFFTIAGQMLGWYFVSRFLPVKPKDLLTESRDFCLVWIRINLRFLFK